jgi:hypothetical protein
MHNCSKDKIQDTKWLRARTPADYFLDDIDAQLAQRLLLDWNFYLKFLCENVRLKVHDNLAPD